MKIADYVEWTKTSAVYPETHSYDYLTLGLLDEIGELCGLLKREIREGNPRDNDAVKKELGDIAWYLARIWTAGYWASENRNWFAAHAPQPDAAAILREMARNVDRSHCIFQFFDLVVTLGFGLHEVLVGNVEKIEGRKKRGTVLGKGDNR